MQLEGSCHCGSVRFTVRSAQPVPFMRCYCSICRKTAGGGGYAINLGADATTLQVLKGRRQLRVYRALMPPKKKGEEPKPSTGQRHFCGRCGSALWLFDPKWPELVHPHASAIDTPLPIPPEHLHMMVGSKANWAEVEGHKHDQQAERYPKTTLAQWHRKRGLLSTS